MKDAGEEGRTRDWLEVFLKGVLMGAADTIPGVSGGTIAFITGIYERLVGAVAGLHPAPLRRIPLLHRRRQRELFVQEIGRMDAWFLAVLGAGVATAVVVLSRFMHAALVAYPGPMNAFFFGLIGASAVVIYRHVSVASSGSLAASVSGFAAAFLVAGVSADGALGHSLPVVFAAGVVASAAMLLPGISGAAFLYILGQYEFMTGALTEFVDSLVAASFGPSFTSAGAVVLVFLLGVAAGLVSIARAVKWSLARYRNATLAALTSLMVGSLRLPVENVLGATSAWNLSAALAVGVPVAVGAALVLGLDRYTEDLEY